MSIRSNIATTVAGATRWGLRSVLKRNGGVLPGRIAMGIDPNLLESLAPLLDGSVVVTGTNGKTTTTNLIADALEAAGFHAVCNRAGNNMETGIVGALLEAKGAGGSKRLVGAFECDELYTVHVLPKLRPSYFVLLNLFRDQLDRYGEIDHTQDVIARALASSPTTTLIFNADDPLCAAIASRVPNPQVPFGIDGPTGTESTSISESRFCAQCGKPLSYEHVHYGQLGSWFCPTCGWSRPVCGAQAGGVELGAEGYAFDLALASGERAHLTTSYKGLYMVYNIMAACTAARELGAPADCFQGVLDAYVPTGGRMTRWTVAGRTVATDLAKNPVGFDRQIQQIKASQGRLVAFFLNDAEADGRDVSWIWDVDFERLAGTPDITAFVGGSRANDLQVRLKYAGIPSAIVDGAASALTLLSDEGADEPLHIVANYTAFPAVVKELEALRDGGALPSTRHAEVAAIPARPTERRLDRVLRIVHLFPDALNLYGDGGNAAVIAQRCAWRGIPAHVDEILLGDELDLTGADIVLMGGGSDRDQLSVAEALLAQRDKLASFIADGGAMLAICGSYQLLGRSYYMGETKLEGLGVIDAETTRGADRIIGNTSVKTDFDAKPLVGFENHAGRTHLGAGTTPLGRSMPHGSGNNGEDGTEGVVMGGLIGTYLHGPALSKNPGLADHLITHALKRRASNGDAQALELIPLPVLDDSCELAAHDAAASLPR